MGRKPLPPDELRINVKIRLPKKLVDDMDQLGSRTAIIENAVRAYIKSIKKS